MLLFPHAIKEHFPITNPLEWLFKSTFDAWVMFIADFIVFFIAHNVIKIRLLLFQWMTDTRDARWDALGHENVIILLDEQLIKGCSAGSNSYVNI